MKKLLFILLAAAMLFGCQKKDVDTTPALQDVSFNATEIIPDVSREGWDCKNEAPTHAYVEISDGTTTTNYSLELFTVGNGLYTQSMKLPVGSYSVTKFLLYKEGNGTAGYQMEDPLDIVTHATPYEDSDYDGYILDPLPIPFDVTAFEKEDIDIEVLCFIDVDYLAFGFDWFEITIIELDQICFFGDICLNGQPFTPADFEGSLYGTGLPIDVPAIMQIVVKQGGTEIATLNNEADHTVPLCIPYYDNEVYTFELWLWLPGDGGFSYQLYYTYTVDDGELINVDMGTDLIFDFVVGTCGNEGDADQTFDFIWLPPPPVFTLTESGIQNPINQVNQDKPWYTYEINGLCIDFTLHNPTSSAAQFDFQIDGDPGTYSEQYSDIWIDEGPLDGTYVGNFYSWTWVAPNSGNVVSTRCGTSEIRVAIHFGAEQLWYLDWATFTAN